MKRKTLILAVISITFISSLFSQTISPGYIDGHLYFKFNDSYSIGFKVNENTSIDYDQLPDLHYLFDRYGVTLITRPLLIFDDQRLARIIRIEFSDAENIDIFIKELELNPDIEYAEKVPYVKEFVTYNDPYYANLSGLNFKWHLEKINAAQAWGLQTGSASVKVAIVDNAVWGAHPDLNISTSNQCNVGNGTTSPGNSAPPTSVSQSTNCTEDDIYEGECQSYKWSHGTHCAGLVGATNNNGIGISSIGGGVTLMGVRAANDDRVMYYNANGVSWAIDNGAKVVSMSYGSVNQSTSERNMYQTAVDNGVILIAAAGNDGDGDNEISYPAGYPMVISVASIDNNGRLSNFSQWGTGRADIAAPGGYDIYYGSIAYPNILSTTYCTNQFYRLIVDMYDFNGTYYDGMQGTSMACPMVAGLVGLMASAYPDITYTQVKSCLQSTATALSSGSNPIDGNGYINAYAAVGCAQSLAGTSGGDCSWLTNITQTDNDNMNEPGGAYLWGQDRTNGIVTYAERFVNTTTGTIDSIEVYVYKAASLTPSYSNVTFRIYGESAGSPGTVLGSKTLAYSYFTQNSVKSIKFDTPVSVSGNFYVGFEVSNTPVTDTLWILSTGNLNRNSTDNTLYAMYNDVWRKANDLYSGDHFESFYIWAKVCPRTSSSLTVAPSTLSYTAAGGNQTINVTSNINWTVSESCNWITVSPSSGSNNGTFTVTASANTGASRTCTITVSGTGVTSQTITVTQAGSTSGGDDDCDWLTNITQTDSDNINEPDGAYLWGQDRTNSIVTYAERFVNTTTGTIDSIEVYVYKAASLTPSSSNVTFRIYGESAGLPGTVLGSKTLAYSYFTQNSVKSIKFDTPVSVSGNFYVGFEVSNTPVTDTLWILSTGNLNRNSTDNTLYAMYNNVWKKSSDLYSGDHFESFYIWAKVCPQTVSPSLMVAPSTLSYTAAGGGKTINVTSNVNWTVSESCNWITVSPSSGSNNGTFTVTASANTGTSRTCVITVSGTGVTPQTITVTQAAASSLSVSPSTLSYTAAGGGKTINVTSNVNWTVSESCNWITVSPSSGSNNGTFTVTASANTGTSRTCVITVSGAGVTPQTITVTQQGYVGIVTEDAESSLMVYPNPTSDYLNIKADFEILQLQIVDVLGKVVLELGDINTDFIDIPVSNLPDAMYVIRVLSNDGNTYYKKITKK